MQLLLKNMGRDTLLLWFSDHAPLIMDYDWPDGA